MLSSWQPITLNDDYPRETVSRATNNSYRERLTCGSINPCEIKCHLLHATHSMKSSCNISIGHWRMWQSLSYTQTVTFQLKFGMTVGFLESLMSELHDISIKLIRPHRRVTSWEQTALLSLRKLRRILQYCQTVTSQTHNHSFFFRRLNSYSCCGRSSTVKTHVSRNVSFYKSPSGGIELDKFKQRCVLKHNVNVWRLGTWCQLIFPFNFFKRDRNPS